MAQSCRRRRTHHLDLHLGRRVRLRRREVRMSMEALAAYLDITYQQVQKYESGANRISAAVLFEIADALKTPISYFYLGLPEHAEPPESAGRWARVDAIGATPGGDEMLNAYLELTPRLRRTIVQLVCGIVGADVQDRKAGCSHTHAI